MLKNRTFLGILCIILSMVVAFAIAPLFNNLFSDSTEIVRLNANIMQGQKIEENMIDIVEMQNYNIPDSSLRTKEEVVGKFAVTTLFKDSFVCKEMLSDTVDTTDSMLRQLKDGEMAMSVTIANFAEGLSGKLITGDIIQIVSVNDEENKEKAIIYDELKFVEVLTTTTESGSDNINSINSVELNEAGNEDVTMPKTITIIVRDEKQALKLAACEKTTLHAILVCRDENRKQQYIDEQTEILKGISSDVQETPADATTPLPVITEETAIDTPKETNNE